MKIEIRGVNYYILRTLVLSCSRPYAKRTEQTD